VSRPRRVSGVALIGVLSTVALREAGSGSLATPPLGSSGQLDAWYLQHGPAVAVVALLRLVALGAGCYLTVVAGLQLIAPLLAVDGLSRAVDRLSPRFLRVVSRSTVGLSLSAALVLPMLPAGAEEDPPGTAVMVPLDVPAVPPSTTTTSSTTTTTTAAPSPTTAPPPVPHAVSTPRVAATTSPAAEVVVARGDSFWSIAVEEAGERDLVGYWRALIDANRDRLVDPSNPDLLYPAQVLRLP
jgi:nucleoid-associated protein YgaU